MKAFAFIGSKHKESSTLAFITELLQSIKRDHINELEIQQLFTPSEYSICECCGCTICFINGNCPIDDDMAIIKNGMLSSDIIIFASPVYLAQVTGSMKVFIDRISYWAHLFRLCGKVGVAVTVSDNNGNDVASNYLKLVMRHLGLSVIRDIQLQLRPLKSTAAYMSIVETEAKLIGRHIQNHDFPITFEQNAIFLELKKAISVQDDGLAEKEYWKANGYFDYDSYSHLFERYCSLL